MAFSISVSDVKRKAMISSTYAGYDTAISNLISEIQPVLEYSIHPNFLEDISNSGLQATLRLGILEVITGEFIEQLKREFGKGDMVEIGGIKLGESTTNGLSLIEQGLFRLSPYTRGNISSIGETYCHTSTMEDPIFSEKENW
ncbi:MAG: hypothetical protein SNJ70_09515 [Armatimonadota bacterium]